LKHAILTQQGSETICRPDLVGKVVDYDEWSKTPFLSRGPKDYGRVKNLYYLGQLIAQNLAVEGNLILQPNPVIAHSGTV
jgi:hypothetical protein